MFLHKIWEEFGDEQNRPDEQEMHDIFEPNTKNSREFV